MEIRKGENFILSAKVKVHRCCINFDKRQEMVVILMCHFCMISVFIVEIIIIHEVVIALFVSLFPLYSKLSVIT